MQAPGQTVKPIENARYEAYQMRVQGRNYNTNAADNTNANQALESMLRPEVLTSTFFSNNSIRPRVSKNRVFYNTYVIYLHIILVTCISCL